jgi:hypothetical protein
MKNRALACLAGFVSIALAGCSFSSGGGGSTPSRTYVVVPSGQAVPAQPAPPSGGN